MTRTFFRDKKPTLEEKLEFRSTINLACVFPNGSRLYISGIKGANNIFELQRNKIKVVIPIIRKDQKCLLNRFELDFEYDVYYHPFFNVADNKEVTKENCSAKIHFEKIFRIVSRAMDKRNENVLIHCNWGVSRSSAIVLSIMMKRFGLTYYESLRRLKINRPIVSPNLRFKKELLHLEREMKKSEKQRRER